MIQFASQPKDLSAILQLVGQSLLGRRTLREFEVFRKSRQVRIDTYPPEILSQLSEVADPGHLVGASFTTDGEVGAIHYDPESPIGIVAPFLFHEIIHSLDLTLWEAASMSVSRSRIREVVFLAECRAFHAQHLFQEELKKIYPSLRAFHLFNYPHIPFLNRALEAREIERLYSLGNQEVRQKIA